VKFDLFSSVRMVLLGSALTMMVPALSGGQAQATPLNGSDTLFGGNVKVSGGVGDLLSATSIGLGLGSQVWSVAGDGATGDFINLGVVGNFLGNGFASTITSSALTMNNLGSFTFTSTDGNFTAASSITIGGRAYTSAVVASSGSLAAGAETLSLYLVGTFTPAGTLSSFDANNASETISFTETGIVAGGFGSFSVSATIASPAAAPPTSPDIPEPASMMLLGAGMAGIGATRRRRV
jgi:hypothetical protein